jgi:hypothetical protein
VPYRFEAEVMLVGDVIESGAGVAGLGAVEVELIL